MKEEKRKVGRPKLADNNLKKESIIVCSIMLFMIVVISVLAFDILTVSFNPKNLQGSVINVDNNSCILKNNKIMCGRNVESVKYTTDDEKNVEVTRINGNITVLVPNKKVKYCYKAGKEYTCNQVDKFRK